MQYKLSCKPDKLKHDYNLLFITRRTQIVHQPETNGSLKGFEWEGNTTESREYNRYSQGEVILNDRFFL